ncbi:LLM class flavin-dependent oxidoreductase [Streptomyces sp. AK02-01A]|uniref:LLM class flavin-dependent oxidoreductase n=1 Tax=Streptomyces sp. AK02-01A TaxID=3028648 RepID=UPI0029B95172|nr:LLM class flavin-dependent oxidoreductase [Streptomyces sp. AK02-01A]MDX3854075.1 LLM class flavin-dependent oxidoreductase [Streptomyces sp. AK02-01A]
MTAYSVLVPFVPNRPEQMLPFAGLVHWTGAGRLWQGQSLATESHQGFAHAAGSGFRVPAGLGVTLMPLRHPTEAALQARSLSLMTGESVLAGYGPGAPSVQQALLGAPYRSPLTAAREYLTAVRAALTGHQDILDGEYVHQEAVLRVMPGPPVELGLGVLRPGMARVAGEVADAAITWLTPARYLRDHIVPAVRESAEKAGRPAPRVVAMVPVALAAADRDPVQLALASNRNHLRAQHYRDMLRRGGVVLPEATGSPAADEAAQGAALVAGDAFLYGEPDELLAKFDAYREAGADEIVLNVTGVAALFGPQAATKELRTLLTALGLAA